MPVQEDGPGPVEAGEREAELEVVEEEGDARAARDVADEDGMTATARVDGETLSSVVSDGATTKDVVAPVGVLGAASTSAAT